MSRVRFEYAVLRVVPTGRSRRGDERRSPALLQLPPFLGARVHLDADRLRALDPTADPAAVEHALRTAAGICDADPDAGPAGEEDPGRRFRWLTAPRSTVVQPGPVHTGLTADPEAELERLLTLLVLPVS